ncbi:MAG TPA: efflux RND transporter periplasmic adaptor subunit [Opitutaceae bacterium]
MPIWLKLAAVAAVLVAAAYTVVSYLRPVAKVEAVISGDAVDAKPGSVVVKEEYSMQMKSAVQGRVLATDYKLEPGLMVKKGDILVQLDTGGIEIEIEQIKANIAAAKQRIALGSTLQFQLDSTRSDFKNTERLFNMGQISQSDYDKARRAVDSLVQQLKMEDVTKQLDLATYENSLKSKLRDKDNMTIRSPLEGEVTYVSAHPGDLIDTGSPIVELITTAREVEAKISEEDFANIRPGQAVSVTFLPYGIDYVFNGTVKKILPTADPETLRHLVDLNVTDISPEKLIPGITGEVSIVVGRRHANAIIPRRALLNDNVFVVKDGVVELRPVKKGYVWLSGVEILAGLQPGEQVIVEELDSFRPGDRVKVQELPSDAITRHG